jgi:predicted RNA-binding Zn ribbon-like protein
VPLDNAIGPFETAAPVLSPIRSEPLPVELMNTIWADRDGVHDALETVDGLDAWLAAIAPRVTVAGAKRRPDEAELAEFRAVRNGLRALAAEQTHDERPMAVAPGHDRAASIRSLNVAVAAAPSWSEIEWATDGLPIVSRKSAATSTAAALADIGERALRLFSGAERDELRACQAPGCVLYFVHDHPRREWCSSVCGNRARVARHYARHHSAAK